MDDPLYFERLETKTKKPRVETKQENNIANIIHRTHGIHGIHGIGVFFEEYLVDFDLIVLPETMLVGRRTVLLGNLSGANWLNSFWDKSIQ